MLHVDYNCNISRYFLEILACFHHSANSNQWQRAMEVNRQTKQTTDYCSAGEPMARVPMVAREMILHSTRRTLEIKEI